MALVVRAFTALSTALLGIVLVAPSASAAGGAPAGAAAGDVARPIASAPPMGWNDWNAFGCKVSEKLVEQTADVLVSSGLRDKGYTYVNIDDCWTLKQRDADGHLVPDPAKFPDGIKGVADYVHARGMKLGIYGDAGTATCAGYPGSLGHEQVDAQTFADWGVDLLKYDNCHPGSPPASAHYQAMEKALDATGRHIVFSICEWGVSRPWDWAPGIGDYWRIDGDIGDQWSSVESIARQLMRHYNGWTGKGFPDPDMLEVGNGGLTPTEERTHFGLWAMYGAPLILGTDLRSVNSDSLSVISNSDVIAVDQQAAGHGVHQVSAGNGEYVLTRSMNDGSLIVALYNEADTPAPVRTTAVAAGLPASPAYTVKNLWAGTTTTSTGTLANQVPAHGLTLLQVTPTRTVHGVAPVVTFDAPRLAGATEYLAGPTGLQSTLSVEAPKGGGALTGLSATLDVPSGWSTDGATTQRLTRLKDGSTQNWNWTLTPTGSHSAVVSATVRWTGADGPMSKDVALRVTPTPRTPSGYTSVAQLPWLHAWSGYATPQRNTGIEGQTLSVAGQTFETGIGSHSESEIAVWLGGNCTRFTTSVGLQDGNPLGSVQGVVQGDGKTMASSDVMTDGKPAEQLSVDVTGVNYLVLHTLPGDNSTFSDRVAWGETHLTCTGFSASVPSTFVPGGAQNVTTDVVGGSQGATDVTTQLSGPDGWSITASSPSSTATLAPDTAFTTTWSVTPPAGTPSGVYQLTAQASYTVNGKAVTDSKVLSVTVARSAHYVYSQKADTSFKRLMRQIAVPAGGGSMTFWTDYDTEPGWDAMFVEAHTPGQEDWTTLPDANGHTSTTPTDSCAYGWVSLHPQVAHYTTWNGTAGDACTSTGTTGSWNGASGKSGGWVQWKVDLSKWAGKTVEVSISYASDWGAQMSGVYLDDITLPDGTTSTFEDGTLDGWTVPGAPAGESANANDYTVVDATRYPAP